MRIRLATPEDALACNAFYNQYYTDKRTLDQWKWEFCSSLYRGPMVPFVLVEDGGRVVGTQAMIPVPMIDNQGTFWTAKSEETLVDPHYRGKRLFARMYELLFDYAKRNDIQAIWGFTPAERAFKRLGFAVPGGTSQLFRPFSGRSVKILSDRYYARKEKAQRSALKIIGGVLAGTGLSIVSSALYLSQQIVERRTFKEGLHLKTLADPPEEIGELSVSFVKQWGGATIFRSADYLRWRIFANPHVSAMVRAVYMSNQLLGWVIYALDDDSMGYIVDLMAIADSADELSAIAVTKILLRDAVKRLQKAGAVGVRAWQINDHPFGRLVAQPMKRMGFFLMRRGHQVVVYPQLDTIERQSLNFFDNWYITRLYTQGLLG
jgi:GNAT superfamily N-acetyltransferase